MAGTYTGLRGTWERPNYELSDLDHTEARCFLFGVFAPLKAFRKVYTMSQDRLLYGKATGSGSGGSAKWVGGVNSVCQVDGDSDMVPACGLCGVRAQKMNSSLCQNFCLGGN